METYTREEAKTETTDDPKARELLRRAFAKTSRWPDTFGGFEADLRINVEMVKKPRGKSRSSPQKKSKCLFRMKNFKSGLKVKFQ